MDGWVSRWVGGRGGEVDTVVAMLTTLRAREG